MTGGRNGGVFRRGQDADGTSDTEPDDPPFWKQRSWMASAVFLSAALTFSAVTFVTGGADGADDTAAPEPAAESGPLSPGDANGDTGGAPVQGPEARPEGCRTDDEAVPEPTEVPADMEWKHIDGFSVPTSPSAGPTRFDDPLWWCYSRTPMGAVLAAHAILPRMSGENWRTVVDQQVVPGSGRDAFVAQRSQLAQSRQGDQDAGTYSGFFVASHSPEAVEVRILVRSPSGILGASTVSMRWSEGDWKVRPDDSGALHSDLSTGTGGDEFVRWGAV